MVFSFVDRVFFALQGWDNAGQVSTALAIARNLGTDVTEEFEYTHSLTAWRQLADFQIGVLAEEEEEEEVDLVPAKHVRADETVQV